MTRVVAVRYLNTAPLIEGLRDVRGLDLVPAAPSGIADMVRTGQADIGLCSLIDAAGALEPAPGDPAPLTLLPVGMIGCDGPTLTVRLYSTTPIERITRVHADTDSHTSVALTRILLAERFGITPELIDFDARERVERTGGLGVEWPEALLMIGDKVVTDSPPAVRYPHQLDLGEAWRAWTGLPFVYAMWACRTDHAETRHVRTAALLLDRQRRHNQTRIDWIVRTRAPEHRWPTDLAKQYLGRLLRYEVGPREIEAARRFAELAHKHALAPGPHLRIADRPADHHLGREHA
ncbi:MAG: hypothetical protein EA378_06970 [Phycisphaerales bacterium]|nr:MAG: hypothetical protein EA378_06970 [Phycisphaerales bacterium]